MDVLGNPIDERGPVDQPLDEIADLQEGQLGRHLEGLLALGQEGRDMQGAAGLVEAALGGVQGQALEVGEAVGGQRQRVGVAVDADEVRVAVPGDAGLGHRPGVPAGTRRTG